MAIMSFFSAMSSRPPPPPPMPSKSPSKMQVHAQKCQSFEDQLVEAAKFGSKEGEILAFKCVRQERPQLQDGPQCGLVALSMAIEIFNKQSVEVERIYEVAKEDNLTR